MKPDRKITLYLSSCGGENTAGLSIISTIHGIRRSGRIVNTHIQGSAYSMASFIAQAGTRRYIESYGTMMLHDIHWGVSLARRDQHIDYLEGAEIETDAVFQLYAERSGKPIAFWREKLKRRDWFVSAQEALDLGLVDEILPIPS
jgi:ATP-dependent Clp protease protease subunit